jgi:hypothetical protein
MLWLVFLVVPILVGASIVSFHSVPRWGWLLLIGIIAVTEIALMGKPSPSWQGKHVIALWVLGVLLPWGGVAAFIARTSRSKRRILAAVSLPMIYFFLIAIGFVLGDSFGLIPQ